MELIPILVVVEPVSWLYKNNLALVHDDKVRRPILETAALGEPLSGSAVDAKVYNTPSGCHINWALAVSGVIHTQGWFYMYQQGNGKHDDTESPRKRLLLLNKNVKKTHILSLSSSPHIGKRRLF